jgi:hypothetical protein
MIHLLQQKATPQQVNEMLQELGTFIKLAVDIERGMLAGGGAMHADCEVILLDDGSQQIDIWGADWVPATQSIEFDAIINIRPNQQNFSMTIQDLNIRQKIELIVRKFLEGV